MVLDKKSPYVRIQSGWFEKNKDKIINELEPLVEEGTTVGGNKSNRRKSDVHLFDIWKLELSDFKKVIIFKIKEIFVTENKKYQYDLDYSSINVQFTRYQKDEFYDVSLINFLMSEYNVKLPVEILNLPTTIDFLKIINSKYGCRRKKDEFLVQLGEYMVDNDLID